jgi:serine protease Do
MTRPVVEVRPVTRPVDTLITTFAAAWLVAATAVQASGPCDLNDVEAQFRAVIDAVQPSVVTVIAYSPRRDRADEGIEALKKNVGSGIVVNDRGHVLTTTGVIGGSRDLFVRTQDGRELKAVRLGIDPRSGLALLAVSELRQTPAPMGSSAGLDHGTWLITIGQRQGVYPSCSFGAFTGLAVSPAVSLEGGLLQMTSRVFPGQTGGAVVNLRGEVVGLLLGSMSPPAGGDEPAEAAAESSASRIAGLDGTDLSVAIPIDVAREVASELDRNGTVSPGFLGVRVRMPTDALRELLGFGKDEGVLIDSIVQGGPAEAAAIEAGDVILAFDGQTVRDPATLARQVSGCRPGDRCTVVLLRGDLRLERHVTLGAQPATLVGSGSSDD